MELDLKFRKPQNLYCFDNIQLKLGLIHAVADKENLLYAGAPATRVKWDMFAVMSEALDMWFSWTSVAGMSLNPNTTLKDVSSYRALALPKSRNSCNSVGCFTAASFSMPKRYLNLKPKSNYEAVKLRQDLDAPADFFVCFVLGGCLYVASRSIAESSGSIGVDVIGETSYRSRLRIKRGEVSFPPYAGNTSQHFAFIEAFQSIVPQVGGDLSVGMRVEARDLTENFDS